MAKKEIKKVANQEKKSPLSLFITIVNRGNASPIISLFNSIGCSAQFVQSGEGTARKEVYDILGLVDNSKDIVLSIVKRDDVEAITKELNAFFLSNKHNKGVAFSIPFSSIIGLKAYHFLINDL